MACRCCNTNGPCTTAADCAIGYTCCDGTCRPEASNWAVSIPATAVEGQTITATVTHQGGCDSEEYYANVRRITTDSFDVAYTNIYRYTANGVGTFPIQILDDTAEEGAESFYVEIFRRGGASLAISNVCTIAASDVQTWSVVSLFGNTSPEGAQWAMRVTTTGVAQGTVFTWRVQHVTTNNADFTNDVQYSNDRGKPLTFQPSGSGTIGANGQANFSIPTFPDAFTEGNETFRVEIVVGGVVRATSALLTISDTSTTPPGAIPCGTAAASGGIQFTQQYYTVAEAGGNVRVHYNVGTLADRFQFFPGNGPVALSDTGFITGQGVFTFFKPVGTRVVRVESQGQDANTRWCYTLMCVNDNSTPPVCNPFA
jgi:hypothetical protein